MVHRSVLIQLRIIKNPHVNFQLVEQKQYFLIYGSQCTDKVQGHEAVKFF